MAKKRAAKATRTDARPSAKPPIATPPARATSTTSKRAVVDAIANLQDAVPHTDGWRNVWTGLGTLSRDKRMHDDFAPSNPRVHLREFQEQLWEEDDVCARIVEKPVDEMMREGWDLTVTELDGEDDSPKGYDGPDDRADAFPPKEGGPPPIPPPAPKVPKPIPEQDDAPAKLAAAVKARYEELGGDDHVRLAAMYARAFGGGAILIGADDGQTLDKPLNLKTIKSVGWMNVLSRNELVPDSYYADPRAAKYGLPKVYRFQVDTSFTGTPVADLVNVKIHESRLVIFPGVFISPRQRVRRQGWGNTVFVRVMQAVQDFQMAYAGGANLLADFAQAVYKVQGLADLIAQGDDKQIVDRARIIDTTRSICRALMIDVTEDFERKATPLTGFPEMIDRFALRLAATVDMPVTVLMGMSPAGLNATGDADVRNWYARLSAQQEKDLKPRIERILRIIMLAQDGPTKGVEPADWCVEFRPLWQLTELEQADLRLKTSQADALDITNGVLTPEEVAGSRYAGRKYSTATTLDLDGRQSMADDAAKAAAQRAAMPPVPPVPAPGKPVPDPGTPSPAPVQ